MPNSYHKKLDSLQRGYTLVELLVVVAIIGVMALSIKFSYSPADSQLKSAARDLYSNLQQIRSAAVKTNTDWGIIFDNANNTYTVCAHYNHDSDCIDSNTFPDRNESIKLVVDLNSYGNDIRYSSITYNPDHVIYSSEGILTCSAIPCIGSVKLTNNKGTVFNVKTTSHAGVVKIIKL